jgi:phage-related tail fiber protein
MASIQIKRSQTTATPSSLLVGELAYSENSSTLFIGTSGNAVVAIGGSGLYAKKADPLTATGDATGTGTLSGGVALTLATTGVTAGTYPKVTVDAKGRVTAGTTLTAADVPTLTSSKISDLQTTINATPLSSHAAPVTSVNLNNQTITNLATPVNGTDAANKNYVDNAVQGLTPKQSVKAATTANISTLSGTMTIDGIALNAGDRVLVKDQTTLSQNGVYIVSSGAWPRSLDTDTWGELVSAYCFVEQGSTNADLGFVCTVDQGGTLGTTNVTWVNFSGAGSIVAGNGLSKSGSTLSALGTANRVSVSSSGIDIASNYVGQTSITTLGAITTGTWTGSIIGLAYGGAGANLSALADGSIIKKLGTSLVAAAAGTDYYNTSSTIDGGTF